MLELKDFFHLPQLDPLFDRLVASRSGLIVVTGLNPRRPDGVAGFPSSGRLAIFRILLRQILMANEAARAIVVAENKGAIRLPRQLSRRAEFLLVRGPDAYAEAIVEAARRRPHLLVVDQLGPETAAATLDAARQGLCVLSQMDTIYRGADVARTLQESGATPEQLLALRWVIAVQRLPTLCVHCRQPISPIPVFLADRLAAYPQLSSSETPVFYQATGCQHCHGSGRQGEVTAFDVFHIPDPPAPQSTQSSLLSLEEYVIGLTVAGQLAPDDVRGLESDQLRRTYNLLTSSERALRQSNLALQGKLLEIEAANQVLQQRTEALLSLQELGQALISPMGLEELAQRVCGHTHDLCGADRAVLYYLRSEETAEILATNGWDSAQIADQVAAEQVIKADVELTPFDGWPPGISPQRPEAEWPLRAGLQVPLVAQGQPVGAMIVQTTHSASFAPGKVALLQTYANQAALAIQRAGLIKSLSDNISQLEAAQAELVQKERLDQELQLAHQVQQSMLPRIFPLVPGYRFSALNRPARHVGGDFYDVFLLDANLLGLVIGDVSDKGMPSALYMALTRSLLHAEARRERSPARVLENVHRLLLSLAEASMFVTVFYGVIDVVARRLTYARAGHDYPLLLRRGAIRSLGGTGILMGISGVGDLQLSEERLDLQSDDRLVLYTDGLTDTLAEDGRMFSLSQFLPVIQRHAHLPLAEFCPAIFADLDAYRGKAEQYDDMTLLVVEVQ